MAAFLATHFNYIAVIILMMVGLYIVFASGNMVKRLIGLGVFQTSVFLLYISIAKVAGGIPPILPETGHHGDDHGAGHGPGAGLGHADAEHAAPVSHGAVANAGEGYEAGAQNGGTGISETSHGGDQAGAEASHGSQAHAGEHGDGEALQAGEKAPVIDHHDTGHAEGAGGYEAVEAIYSNPLPHVLILTAIVVGVATLAVGLALVVRIREAYGTIEDDDINEEEFAAETKGGER